MKMNRVEAEHEAAGIRLEAAFVGTLLEEAFVRTRARGFNQMSCTADFAELVWSIVQRDKDLSFSAEEIARYREQAERAPPSEESISALVREMHDLVKTDASKMENPQ